MTIDSEAQFVEIDDADLIQGVRAGNRDSEAQLFRRHKNVALSVAYRHTDTPSEADDIVSESFLRVFSAIRSGSGPAEYFRAYLLTAVSREAFSRNKAASRVTVAENIVEFNSGDPNADENVKRAESAFVIRAFQSLPERWRAVLWHTEIEDLRPREIAPILGLTPNAVSALAVRAREGLREAYLAAHLNEQQKIAAICFKVRQLFPTMLRSSATKRDKQLVNEHLRTCEQCVAVFAELEEVGTKLRAFVLPWVVGGITVLGVPAAGGVGAVGTASAVSAGTPTLEPAASTLTSAGAVGGAGMRIARGAILSMSAGLVITAIAVVASAVGIFSKPTIDEPAAEHRNVESTELGSQQNKSAETNDVVLTEMIVDSTVSPTSNFEDDNDMEGVSFPGTAQTAAAALLPVLPDDATIVPSASFSELLEPLPNGRTSHSDETQFSVSEPPDISSNPDVEPTHDKSLEPSVPVTEPTDELGISPSVQPSEPIIEHTVDPSTPVTMEPTEPAVQPTIEPSIVPTEGPTSPMIDPSGDTTDRPTVEPTKPVLEPTVDPSSEPTDEHTDQPTVEPTIGPSIEPTDQPTLEPTAPTESTEPIVKPTEEPAIEPTVEPTGAPTDQPTLEPIEPTEPIVKPTVEPAIEPTVEPTGAPTDQPTLEPIEPTEPIVKPTVEPSIDPTEPAVEPTDQPTSDPTEPFDIVEMRDLWIKIERVYGQKFPTYSFTLTPKEGIEDFSVEIGFDKIAWGQVDVLGQCESKHSGRNVMRLTCKSESVIRVGLPPSIDEQPVWLMHPRQPKTRVEFTVERF
ncbi:sigma-70 family RNA polymerase sigma factor [Glutamicibacter sp.]|uniref:RNA polymerase sigma factor n=1 Tax=Glutamicibacter sp. TaxID=1931995 RepID=UPI0028BE9189|nr:sigma-70 family RNA polymerase sigma factor [Glutamicibacter sp.]